MDADDASETLGASGPFLLSLDGANAVGGDEDLGCEAMAGTDTSPRGVEEVVGRPPSSWHGSAGAPDEEMQRPYPVVDDPKPSLVAVLEVVHRDRPDPRVGRCADLRHLDSVTWNLPLLHLAAGILANSVGVDWSARRSWVPRVASPWGA